MTDPQLPDFPGLTLKLQQLSFLASEIETATLAIRESQLTAFEESLWKQEALCSSLSQAVSNGLDSSSPDLQDRERLRAAYAILLTKTRRYSQSLIQAERSHKMFCALSATRQGQPSQAINGPVGTNCSVEA